MILDYRVGSERVRARFLWSTNTCNTFLCSCLRHGRWGTWEVLYIPLKDGYASILIGLVTHGTTWHPAYRRAQTVYTAAMKEPWHSSTFLPLHGWSVASSFSRHWAKCSG